jgi:histidine triad (HIT) family protein
MGGRRLRCSVTNVEPLDESGCEFCRIIRGETEARVVGEESGAIAFLPLTPATLGHTLVVPKEHIRDIWSLPPGLIEPLGRLTLRVANAIREAMHPEGLNIINSNGAAASQTVPHLHVHVVPRWADDEIGEIWPPKERRNELVQDEVLVAIRAAFDRL